MEAVSLQPSAPSKNIRLGKLSLQEQFGALISVEKKNRWLGSDELY